MFLNVKYLPRLAAAECELGHMPMADESLHHCAEERTGIQIEWSSRRFLCAHDVCMFSRGRSSVFTQKGEMAQLAYAAGNFC
jgi:hypothetical protein